MPSDRLASQAEEKQLVSNQVQAMLTFTGDAFRGGSVLHSAASSGSMDAFEAILAVPEVRCGLLQSLSVFSFFLSCPQRLMCHAAFIDPAYESVRLCYEVTPKQRRGDQY